MTFLSDILGGELTLFFWAFVGAIIGLCVELATGTDKKTTVLFVEKIRQGNLFVRLLLGLINVLIGSLIAYLLAPLLIDKLQLVVERHRIVYFLLGVAGLSIIRAYVLATRSRSQMADLFFKIVDLVRGGK